MRRLQDYQPLFSALLRTVCIEHHFEDRDRMADVLRNPRLVVAVNHSTPLSWIPPICLLTEKACENGGGDRIPRGIVEKLLFMVPGLRILAEYLSQSDRPQSFDEILRDFSASERTDLVVFPEGAGALFGDLKSIQPFRSPRFVELAIRAQAPILLVAHRGTEFWNTLFPVPKDITPYISMVSSFFGKRMGEEQYLNLPLNLKRIPRFSMITKLYLPALYESDLSGDPRERRRQIEAEAENIRLVMQEMFDELGARHAELLQPPRPKN